MKIIHKKEKTRNRIKELLYMNTLRRLFVKFGVYMVLLTVAILVALIPNLLSNMIDMEPKPLDKLQSKYPTDLKYILLWNHQKNSNKHLINKYPKYLSGQMEFFRQNCPNINCYITYNRSLLYNADEYDAVVFDIHDIKHLSTYNVNLGRSPHQIYIFKSLEPAENNPICSPKFDDFFNWTWTYKLDSDIPQPFISIHDNKSKRIGPKNPVDWPKDIQHDKINNYYESKLSMKTKAVAWLITNCKLKNKYRVFIRELRKELQEYSYTLDIFGPCDSNKCPKGGLNQCYLTIEENYFFILITEDAFAEDYVTERVGRAMNYNSLPIIYGGANYSNFLPPGSYINAYDFGIKKLGSVIDYLIRNREKYTYFMDWKQYYYYTTFPRNNVCDLCKKLNEQNITRKKTFKGIRKWWNPDFDQVCQRDNLYELFNQRET